MKNIISLLLVFSLSTNSIAGRVSRINADVDFPEDILSHPKFLRMIKDQTRQSDSFSSVSLKDTHHLLRPAIKSYKDKHRARLKRIRNKAIYDDHRMQVDDPLFAQIQHDFTPRNRFIQDDNRMDVDSPSWGQIQQDLDAMDWMLTGCHITGSMDIDEEADSFNGRHPHSNQMDWMPMPPLEMADNSQNGYAAPFSMDEFKDVLDTEMGEPVQAFSAGSNFYNWVMGNEDDVIKLHGYGCDLASMKSELEERANYLNYAWHMHGLKQHYDDYTIAMMRAGIENELSQLGENIHWMSYYLSSLETKINWIIADPSQEYQRYALHMHIEALEEKNQQEQMPVFYYVLQPELPAREEEKAQSRLGELSTTLQRSFSQEIAFRGSSQFDNTYDVHTPITSSFPANDWMFSFQEITPVVQTPYVYENPGVDRENVMRLDRQRAAQGSVPSVMSHTDGWMRSDIQAHEEELFNEVLSYLKSMLPQKHKFKRKESHLDKISNAIHALIGKCEGNDFPNFLNPNEITMRGGGAAITVKTLLARTWIAIKNHKDKHESENMKHSLILALGNCIEKDGHRVCIVGKTQRILSVLQGYVKGIDMDRVKEKTDVKPSNSPTGSAVKEEPKPEFGKFFNNFMITKNALMQTIAGEPEEHHRERLQQVVQDAVDEVCEVYGDDAEKIKKTKESFKAFIDLTFDVEIDYDAIKASPKSLRGKVGSGEESKWKQPVANAKAVLKKMVDKVSSFCIENAPKMTKAVAETVFVTVQFLRSYAASLFAS